MTAGPRRQAIVAPLRRRESIGRLYHVLTFEVTEAVVAQAGQFAMIRGADWGDAPLLPRPMSYLTAGAEPSVLIKVVGEGTRRMAAAAPGEQYALLGPLGNTWRPRPEGRRAVLVAGGVGIAPLLFLARQLSESGHEALAIYGGRSASDLPLDEDLAEVSHLMLCTEDGTRGEQGRVTDALAKVLASSKPDELCVYTCGPDRMMARVAEMCAEVGVPCEASLETPMACGYGVCLGCPVARRDGSYLYACTEGPCIDAETIDWAAAEPGP